MVHGPPVYLKKNIKKNVWVEIASSTISIISISSQKMTWTLILINVNPHYPRMHCVKFGSNNIGSMSLNKEMKMFLFTTMSTTTCGHKKLAAIT